MLLWNKVPCFENLQTVYCAIFRNTVYMAIAANEVQFFDCCRNMGYFLWSRKGWAFCEHLFALHCHKTLLRIDKMSTLTPRKNFCGRPMPRVKLSLAHKLQAHAWTSRKRRFSRLWYDPTGSKPARQLWWRVRKQLYHFAGSLLHLFNLMNTIHHVSKLVWSWLLSLAFSRGGW